jgi:hypothetical protein
MKKEIDQEYFLKNGQVLRENFTVISTLGFRRGEKQFYIEIEDAHGFTGDCMTPETAKKLAKALEHVATRCMQEREKIGK